MPPVSGTSDTDVCCPLVVGVRIAGSPAQVDEPSDTIVAYMSVLADVGVLAVRVRPLREAVIQDSCVLVLALALARASLAGVTGGVLRWRPRRQRRL